MSAGLITNRIAEAEALAALEPEWWDLWRRSPAATPFQSPAWLIPWWRSFHPGELFVMTVRTGGQLVGLAPFYIEDGTHGRRILPIGISVSDYLDVLVDPVFAVEVGDDLAHHLTCGEEHWDEWDLEELAPGAAALDLPVPPECSDVRTPQSACPVLVMRAGASSVFDFVPARKRRDTNLARNRAARRGEVVIELADEVSGPAILDTLFDLHRARWRSRGEDGVLANDPVRDFHRAAAPALLRAGLRLSILRIDGRPAAVHYGFMHKDRAYSYLTGLDPEFAFESPGVILLADALERALSEGAREFHFLRGREAYKYEWGAVDRWNVRRAMRRSGKRRAHA